MDGAHASGNGTFSYGKHGGFLLLELLCTIGLIAIATAMMVPVIGNWYEERMLDLAAAEAAAVIRQVETEARNEREKYKELSPGVNLSSGLKLFFVTKNNRIYYYAQKGTVRIPFNGYLNENVKMISSIIELKFNKSGVPSGNQVYRIFLVSASGKYRRTIVVQSYTGRVRIE